MNLSYGTWVPTFQNGLLPPLSPYTICLNEIVLGKTQHDAPKLFYISGHTACDPVLPLSDRCSSVTEIHSAIDVCPAGRLREGIWCLMLLCDWNIA